MLCFNSDLDKEVSLVEETLDESKSIYEPIDEEDEAEEDDDSQTGRLKIRETNENTTDLERKSISLLECSSDSSASPVKFDYSFNVPGNSACDDSNLKSKLSKDENVKKHLCCFCDKLQTRLARHLILKHGNEDEVKEFIHLPAKSQERLSAIAKIRKQRDFKMFTDAKLNNGEIIPSRRPTTAERANAENFATCPNCKGIYTKNNLRHHFAQCTNNEQNVKGVFKKARLTVGRIHERASEVLRLQVISCMKEDAVLRCLRYDLLIILYGNDLCLSHRHKYMHKLIRSNLRLCGRFLLHIKELDPRISSFSAIYDPTKYYFIINAIDFFACVNKSTGHYNKAGNATEMAKHINKIGDIYLTECIIEKNVIKQKEITDFLSLCKRGFRSVTNKTANETLLARQREKIVELPSTADIMRLCQYLDKIIDVNYSKLKIKFSYSTWRQLSEAVLTRIQVFNRRRAGEAERLFISDLKNVQIITNKDEDFQNLSDEEKGQLMSM